MRRVPAIDPTTDSDPARGAGSRGWVPFALAAVGVVALLAALGCSAKKNPLRPNSTPETTVFVEGPVDTVNHRVRIFWFGSDADGDVVAYRMRFVHPPPASQDPPWDTLTCAEVRRCNDSLFTMQTGDSAVVSPRFEIAAIDDDGAIDPTPAVQTFLLSNLAPSIVLSQPLGAGDTTYASVTQSWTVVDPDGGGPGLHFRVWLDGNEAIYDSTFEFSYTVPTDRFRTGATFLSGPRTLYVQAVDDGGRIGPPSTMTWYVRAPAQVLRADGRGELLIIDEVPSGSSATFDLFYASVVQESLAPTHYSVLRPQFNPRIFRSARDFAQTLRQFKAVLWYRGLERSVSSLLTTYQDSLGGYLDGGGNLYLDGLYLVEGLNSPGSLRDPFVTRYLGSSGLYMNFDANVGDSTAGWTNRSNALLRSSAYDTTMRTATTAPGIPGSTGGIRAFVVTDTSHVALWAMDSQLTPANAGFEAPVGVTVPQLGGGRLVLIAMPIRIGPPIPATTLLRRMLYGFGAIPGVIRPGDGLFGLRR